MKSKEARRDAARSWKTGAHRHSTHNERMAYARRILEENPGMSMNGTDGLRPRIMAHFGKCPPQDLLLELAGTVAIEQANKRRDRPQFRNPALSPESAVALQLVPTPTPEPEKKDNDMGHKVRRHRHADDFKKADRLPGERIYPADFIDEVIQAVDERPEGVHKKDVVAEYGISLPEYYRHVRERRGPSQPAPAPKADDGFARFAKESVFMGGRTPSPDTFEKYAKNCLTAIRAVQGGEAKSAVAKRLGIHFRLINDYLDDPAFRRDAYKALSKLDPDWLAEYAREGQKPASNGHSGTVATPAAAPPPVAQTSAPAQNLGDIAEVVKTALRLLLEEAPNLATLTITNPQGGTPVVDFTVHAVERHRVEL